MANNKGNAAGDKPAAGATTERPHNTTKAPHLSKQAHGTSTALYETPARQARKWLIEYGDRLPPAQKARYEAIAAAADTAQPLILAEGFRTTIDTATGKPVNGGVDPEADGDPGAAFTNSDDTERFRVMLQHLNRGGNHNYFWRGRLSTWYNANETPDIPEGANWFFGVHPCAVIPPKSKKGNANDIFKRGQIEHVAAINCLYAEFDTKDLGGDKVGALSHIMNLPVLPTYITDSGGGYHAFWALDKPFLLDSPEWRKQAQDIQYRWVSYVGGDDQAKDLARHLRVPGSTNRKPRYGPDGRPVVFVVFEPERQYNLQNLVARLPKPATKPKPPKRLKPRATVTGANGPPSGDGDLSVERVIFALDHLSTHRCDRYADWLAVGMALHNDLGDLGLPIWVNWSRSSPKFVNGECEEKWETFTVGGGKTIGTVFGWAKEDSPQPRQQRQPVNLGVVTSAPSESDAPDRCEICGRHVAFPDPSAPNKLIHKRLVCGDYRHCPDCAERKARAIHKCLVAALGDGPLFVAKATVSDGRKLIRRHGKANVLRIPVNDGVIIFNPDTGEELTTDTIPDLVAIVRSIPPKKRISGGLGGLAGAHSDRERSDDGETADILVKTLVTTAGKERERELYAVAFERVRPTIHTYALGTADGAEKLIDRLVTEFKRAIIESGYQVERQITKNLQCDLRRNALWGQTYAQNHVGTYEGAANDRQPITQASRAPTHELATI